MKDENKPLSEEEIIRWMDGELEGEALARVERLAAGDAELLALREQSRWFGGVVGDVPSAKRGVADLEAFHLWLNGHLDAVGAEFGQIASREEKGKVVYLRDWRIAGGWLVAAASVVVAMLVMFQQDGSELKLSGLSEPLPLIATYSPHGEVSIEAYYDINSEVVVILLDGVEPIESEVGIAGVFSDGIDAEMVDGEMVEERIIAATGRWFDLTLASVR